MKRMLTVLVVAVLGAWAARASVFDDAKAWYRGARDGNGDGVFTDGKCCFRDVMHASDPTHDNHKVVNASATGSRILVQSMDVHCPYRNETLPNTPCLYFPSPVETNGWADVGGVQQPVLTVKANGVNFPSLFSDAPGDGPCANYTAVFRIRYDSPVNNATGVHSQLLSMGYRWASGTDVGIAFALEKESETTRYLQYLNGSTFQRDNGSWKEGEGRTISTHIPQGRWVDVAVAVDGAKMLVGYTWDDSVGSASAHTNRMVRWFERTAAADKIPAVRKTGTVRFGYEELATTTFTNGVQQCHNACKAFRGALHQFALWHRTLSKEEMLEAFAGGRPDAFNIGMNGKAADVFTKTMTSVDSNGAWEELNTTLTPANPSASVGFFYFRPYDKDVSQLFRVTLASGSASGTLAVTVNGKAAKQKIAAEPGKAGFAFVPASCFQTGANMLTVTRVDGGADPLVIETMSLGGGWQRGSDDGHGDLEFEYEGNSVNTIDLADGNLKHFKRGYVPWSSAYGKEIIRFDVPSELAGNIRSTVYFRTSTVGVPTSGKDFPFHVLLNGEEIYTIANLAKNTGYTIKLPREALKAGTNELEFGAMDGAGGYINNSCWRFSYDGLPTGLMLLFK